MSSAPSRGPKRPSVTVMRSVGERGTGDTVRLQLRHVGCEQTAQLRIDGFTRVGLRGLQVVVAGVPMRADVEESALEPLGERGLRGLRGRARRHR